MLPLQVFLLDYSAGQDPHYESDMCLFDGTISP